MKMKILVLSICLALTLSLSTEKYDVIGVSSSNPYAADRPAVAHNVVYTPSAVITPVSL